MTRNSSNNNQLLGVLNYKLLLYYKHNKLNEYFLKVTQEVMTPQQAENFFINSFDFDNNLYSIKLLYIELKNLTYIKDQMSLVKEKYNTYYKYPSKKTCRKS